MGKLDTFKININQFFDEDENCNQIIKLIYETETFKSLNFLTMNFINLLINIAKTRIKNDLKELIDIIFINFQDLAPNLILIEKKLIFKDTNLITKILGYFTENGTKTERKRLNNLYINRFNGKELDNNLRQMDNILKDLLQAIAIDVEVNSENQVTQLLLFRMGLKLKCNLSDNMLQLGKDQPSLKRTDSNASTDSLISSSDEEEPVEAKIPTTVNPTVTLIPGKVSDQIQYGNLTLDIQGYSPVVESNITFPLIITIIPGEDTGDFFLFKGYVIEIYQYIRIQSSLSFLEPTSFSRLNNNNGLVLNTHLKLQSDNTFRSENNEYHYKIISYRIRHWSSGKVLFIKETIPEIIEEFNKSTYQKLPFYPSDKIIALDEDNKFTVYHLNGL